MEIDCPKCGAENWLENQSRCLSCGAILRRCADCESFDRKGSYCNSIKSDIGPDEVENPRLLSSSSNCQFYRPLPRVIHRYA